MKPPFASPPPSCSGLLVRSNKENELALGRTTTGFERTFICL